MLRGKMLELVLYFAALLPVAAMLVIAARVGEKEDEPSWAIYLLGLLGLGVLIYGLYLWFKERQKKRAEKEEKNQ
jgi:drug/metabolite transporter (DMT)-like permease